jgi:hypothetical protein
MSKIWRMAVLCLLITFPWIATAAEFPTDRPVLEDNPAATITGNSFTIPAGWSVSIKGFATIITPPEGDDSHIVFVDIEAEDTEDAVAKA